MLLLLLEVMFCLDGSSMLCVGSSFRLGFCCNALSLCNARSNLWSQLLQHKSTYVMHFFFFLFFLPTKQSLEPAPAPQEHICGKKRKMYAFQGS